MTSTITQILLFIGSGAGFHFPCWSSHMMKHSLYFVGEHASKAPLPSRLFAFLAGLAEPTAAEREWLRHNPDVVRLGRKIHASWESLQEAARVRRRQSVEAVGRARHCDG
jgi:hypothetical protein